MSASSKKKLRKEQAAEMMTERQKQERAEARKLKSLTAVFIIIVALVVCIFVGTQVTTAVTRYGLIEKATIVTTIGDHKLNSVTMNYFFYDAVNADYTNLQNTYGDYASSFIGFDVTKPLSEQKYDETGKTWADHYLEVATENARTVYAMYDLAEADNTFQLSEDVQTSISNTLLNMQFTAMLSYGIEVDDYLRGIYGNGANEKSYEEYLTIQATATAYYDAHQQSLSYDDAAISAHEADHYNDYSSYTFNSYYLPTTSFLPEESESTEYTEAEKEAARAAAEAAANELVKATTVEELDAAIAALEINADAEEAPASTLNTDVAHTTLYDNYAEWLSASDRAEGNAKVFPSTTTTDGVETVNGYYVLMFKSRNDNLEPLANVRHILINYEGGTTDDSGNTTYSDEEKAAAMTKAEELLQQWKDGDATEDSFIALVADNTGDTASAETGGLYEDIYKTANYEPEFLNWAIDPVRNVGDTGIVSTSYGCHIMYYVGDSEMTNREYLITQDLIANDMAAWEESVLANVTAVPGNSSKINKDLVYMPASA